MPIARFLLSLLLISSTTLALGQTNKELIVEIRTEFNRINTIPDLKAIELNNEEFLEQMTDGGGSLTGYFQNDQLVKLVQWVGFSIGNSETEYYLKEGKLFFAYQVENKFADKEGGEVGELDYTKTERVFEGRYYFSSGKLIKTIEKDKRILSQQFELLRFLKHADEVAELMRNKLEN